MDGVSQKGRTLSRFEPKLLDVILVASGVQNIRGRVLDCCEKGMAIAFPHYMENIPDENSGIVKLEIELNDRSHLEIGQATVKRRWSLINLFNIPEKGIAIELNEKIPINGTDEIKKKRELLFSGVNKNDRISMQELLAQKDIDYLGNYRKSLMDCQLRLFNLAVTISVMIGSIYFSLVYYSKIHSLMDYSHLSILRTFIASTPGFLSISLIILITHKYSSLQKATAFLTILKECIINKNYLREYYGWENICRKYKHIFKTNFCTNCHEDCKTIIENNYRTKIEERKRGLINNPLVDLYSIILYSTLFFILILSIVLVCYELLNFQREVKTYILLSSSITIMMMISLVCLCYFLIQFRIGKYSFDYYRMLFITLLHKCRYEI